MPVRTRSHHQYSMSKQWCPFLYTASCKMDKTSVTTGARIARGHRVRAVRMPGATCSQTSVTS